MKLKLSAIVQILKSLTEKEYNEVIEAVMKQVDIAIEKSRRHRPKEADK